MTPFVNIQGGQLVRKTRLSATVPGVDLAFRYQWYEPGAALGKQPRIGLTVGQTINDTAFVQRGTDRIRTRLAAAKLPGETSCRH